MCVYIRCVRNTCACMCSRTKNCYNCCACIDSVARTSRSRNAADAAAEPPEWGVGNFTVHAPFRMSTSIFRTCAHILAHTGVHICPSGPASCTPEAPHVQCPSTSHRSIAPTLIRTYSHIRTHTRTRVRCRCRRCYCCCCPATSEFNAASACYPFCGATSRCPQSALRRVYTHTTHATLATYIRTHTHRRASRAPTTCCRTTHTTHSTQSARAFLECQHDC